MAQAFQERPNTTSYVCQPLADHTKINVSTATGINRYYDFTFDPSHVGQITAINDYDEMGWSICPSSFPLIYSDR